MFCGIVFRRYPESENLSDRVYYRSSTPVLGEKLLHRAVYRKRVGPIPDGCDVHHRDHDPLNNAPDNLEPLTGPEHLAAHPLSDERREQLRDHAVAIQPLTKAWHASTEGIAWHAAHGRDSWKERQSERRSCEHCKEPFDSVTRRPDDRFCSNRCKSAARRATGVDDEDRYCEACSRMFRCNRYAKTRTCSRRCGQAVRAS